MYLNTYGGSVFAATDIVAAMKSQAKDKVTVVINGLAASAGSIIAMGADRIVMDANSYLMLHKPYCTVEGNSDAMRKQADLLDKMQDTILDLYMSRAKKGVTREVLMSLIENETWLNATDAQKYFNVEVETADEAAVPIVSSVSMYASTPVRVAAKVRFLNRDEHDEEEQLPGPADVDEKTKDKDEGDEKKTTPESEETTGDPKDTPAPKEGEESSTDPEGEEGEHEGDPKAKPTTEDEEVCPKCNHNPCTCEEDEKARVQAKVNAFRVLLYEAKEVL